MKKAMFPILAVMALLCMALPYPAKSCVGRILTLSVEDSAEQKLVGEILATFITERTGTTVNVVAAPDGGAGTAQADQCQGDICIKYLNAGIAGLDQEVKAAAAQESLDLVRRYYLENKGLVWMRPLGYLGPQVSGDKGSPAVPVVSKEALDRFPLLDRLLSKLGERLDDETLHRLIQEAEAREAKLISKEFLKTQNLI